MDPFDTLGLPARFAIDLSDSEKRYRDLSRALHPDRYVGRPASERRMALSRAIEVNEAWRTLRDPVKRAEALLRRAGVEIAEDKQAQTDPELLMEMMEQREALSDARGAHDSTKLQSLIQSMRNREKSVLTALGQGLDGPDGPAAHALLPVLGELRFVRRFLEEASAAEDELT
jgi:molecular chaperone HscB